MDFVSGVSSTYDFSIYAQRRASLSDTSKKTSKVPAAEETASSEDSTAEEAKKADAASTEKTSFKVNSAGKELTKEDQKEVEKLKARDEEVKQHEQAHQRAGAGITGQAKYTYEAGPDGKQYAVGGSVSIDMSEEDTAQATISKAEKIRRTALAPKDPSSQDLKVAQEASQMENDARAQAMAQAQAAAKSYGSVKNIPTSKTSASAQGESASTGAGAVTGTGSSLSSVEGAAQGKESSAAADITEAAGAMVNPYAELSAKMSENTTDSIEIKAYKSRNLSELSRKAVDLFG